MILGSQSISNESETFNDYRYQKALKEISKLINVNREIKIESEKCRQEYEQLAQKNSQLLEINSSLENENIMLRDQLQALHQRCQQLEEFCKKTQHEQKLLMKSNEVESQQKLEIQQRHSAEMEQLQHHFREQVDQLMGEIQNRDKVINELQEKVYYVNQLEAENDKLHQRYEVALKENADLNQKLSSLNQQLVTASTKIKHQPNQDLINKLKINQEWIKSLNQENYNLKQKLFQEEYKKQRQKCNQTLLKNVKDTTALINLSSTNANQILIKQYLKQVQKKIKKTEEEKQKFQSKYNKLKTRYHQLKVKSNSMQKEINLLTIKLSGYEQLTERQQREIEQMIQEYHKEMDKVISNRKKTHSAHHIEQPSTSNQSSLREKELKNLVQNLQTQILQNKAQSQQKDKLIKFLQVKIQSLQAEKGQLQKTNQQIQQSLESSLYMDLSKTSKVYSKQQNLLKTHSLTKSGGKVFAINGKKYETKVLKSKESIENVQQETEANEKINRNTQEIKQGKKVNFPPKEISYISSQRNYGTELPLTNVQRA